VYLDDSVSFAYRKGDSLRERFTCRLSEKGLVITVAKPEGSFAPWWKLLQVEVYGASRPAAESVVKSLDGANSRAVSTAYDAEHHRISALVPDSGAGLELQLTY